mgnify:FL=1|jgi:glycosyltransferase involved in cell wall biosynthesis
MKSKDTIISVIVPIYNVSCYLKKCLDSIINQKYKNLEIVLVDDGSTDGSSKICDDYASYDERIKVIHKKNEGLVRARKTGLLASSGDIIAYVDGDDWIESDMIETLYNIMESQDVDIVMCGRYEDAGDIYRQVYHGIPSGRYDKDSMIKKVYPNMIVNQAFFEWGVFPGVWDKLFKRVSLEKYQMEVDDRLTMGEDAACVYPTLLNAQSIYVLHKCLYHYRQSVNSMVKQSVDVEIQRRRFNILFNTVNKSFEEYAYIFDLREQWKEYILFLMVPRADALFKEVSKLQYLYPFPSVNKGSNIIIYCMGTYGQLLSKYIHKSGFCNIVVCVDKNYIELRKQGLNVISPDEINNYEYDWVVVANSFANARRNIFNNLSNKVPKEKICLMDEQLIKSESSLKAFGLV